ncbi:MAG: PilZ domain-containing protein [Pyrinomonadaceae bacterium]
MSDRRRYPRVRVSLYIDWGFSAACPLQARVTSVSVGGCFVQTDEAVEAGQTVYVRLSLPEERLLQGEVRYHMPSVGFGLQFQDVTIEDQLMLETLVAHYAKEG